VVASERVGGRDDDRAAPETSASGLRWRYEVVGVRSFVRKPAEAEDLARVVSDVAERAGWK
jgi:hypothetical protein